MEIKNIETFLHRCINVHTFIAFLWNYHHYWIGSTNISQTIL